MSDLTDYAEDQFMNWSFFSTDMPAAHTSVNIALHTSDPGDTLDGSTEVGAGDYSREPVTADGTEWSSDTSGSGHTVSNDNEISFGTATSDWGTVSHFSVWDGAGNPLWASALDTSKTVNTDDEIRFQAGALTADLD